MGRRREREGEGMGEVGKKGRRMGIEKARIEGIK